jgi:hypothetical protein
MLAAPGKKSIPAGKMKEVRFMKMIAATPEQTA